MIINREDTYKLSSFERDEELSVDTYSISDKISLNSGDGVKIDLSGLSSETEIYYEVSVWSIQKQDCLFTIPYLKEVELKIPNDLPPEKYKIYLKTLEGTILPKKWFNKPVLSFKTVTSSRMEKTRSYMLNSDKEVYYEIGDKFKELAADLYETHEFVTSYSSKKETFEKITTMITKEKLELDLCHGQKAICIVPNRTITINDGIKSYLKVNGERVRGIEGSKFIHFEVTGKSSIIETMFGNHYKISSLPFYAYVFSALVK